MDAKTLSALWASPDNSRLTAKQQSFRLPVHVDAKLAALCELYPNKTKTQIVGDLFSTPLADVQTGLPAHRGSHLGADDEAKQQFYASGPIETYRVLANKHFEELEREFCNESPQPHFPHKFTMDEDGE